MWAYQLTTPHQLTMVELPAPTETSLQDGEVLLRSLAGGICGSDIPKFEARPQPGAPGGRPLPGPIGFPLHEIVGEVVVSRADKLNVGDRVVGWASASNGLAEYVVTDGDRVATYDPALDPIDAVLVQPLACVLNALDRVDVRNRHVAVLGLGPIGALFAHTARARGASQVTGVDPVDRAALGSSLGFDTVQADSDRWLQALVDGDRPAICIEAVGHQTQTLNHALHATAAGGTVIYFGIPDEAIYPVDIERLMRARLTLIGGVTVDHRRALDSADRHLAAHPELNELLVTHTFDRSHAQQAFEIAGSACADRVKVVLDLR